MIGKIFKIIINTLLLGLFAVGVLVVLSLVPIPGNYKIFTVQSGSMEPTLHTGSLIFVKPLSDYEAGDVVTRKTEDPKVTITHRIFSKEKIDGQIVFRTKGDANDAPDGEKITASGIIGREFLTIPLLGYLTSYAKTQTGIILIIIIPAVIIIYDEMNKIKNELQKKKMASKKVSKNENGTDEEIIFRRKRESVIIAPAEPPRKKIRIV